MQMKIKDINVHFEITGRQSAPVVICSHCLAGSTRIWDPQMQALQENYRVLVYDVRGHGQTSAPEGDYSMDLLAEDALALMDSMEIGQAHFMGISMGGMIGQTLALKYPDRITGLILCDTASQVPADAGPVWEERIAAANSQGMAALADGTLERWLSPEFREQYPDTTQKIREIVLSTPVNGFAGCGRAIAGFDIHDRLPQLSAPTLIMVGENDPGTPVEAARQIHGQIRGSRLEVLDQAYHLSNVEAAESFNTALLDFLERI
ncbi:MAG: 3-oxoadipate enol-lactonase [Desulfobacterales bacterium]|nr:3-oxoadipate enol-lactonase [Desulfobacterales bacterium]